MKIMMTALFLADCPLQHYMMNIFYSPINISNILLCRLWALVDVRKHFNIMKTKTELLHQCHNPER